MKRRILVVDDELVITKYLSKMLIEDGFEVYTAHDGAAGYAAYLDHQPDLVILDYTMPEMSGFEVCRKIRETDQDVYIFMLTGKEHEVNKVVGLELGADDYIVKPFSMHELVARIHAAFRRAPKPEREETEEILTFGNVRINISRLTGTKGDELFPITSREAVLLKLFMAQPGIVLTRDYLLEKVWGHRYSGTTRTLDQHIAKLRQKIEDDPANPKHILTVHCEGYRFNVS